MKSYKTSEAVRGQAKRARAKVAKDPDKVTDRLAWQKRYRTDNKERLSKKSREYQQKNSVEIRLHRKGLKTEENIELVRSHIGVCDICEGDPDGKWKQLNIDHCHNTGKLRGMLCSNCNMGIGKFKDDPELLRRAAIYLEGMPSD